MTIPALQYVMLKRPTTIEDVVERMKNFRSTAACDAADRFVARATDVFISTYPKSGTTWMQQVVHQIQTGGNTDFEEISLVVPWLESAVDTGVDPEAEQAGGFRSFKCHLLHKNLPQGARYITVVRDPASVLKSFYNFFSGCGLRLEACHWKNFQSSSTSKEPLREDTGII